MNFTKQKVTLETAKNICSWEYPDEYAFYNMGDEENIIEEMLTCDYYAVFKEDELIGFYATGKECQVPDKASNDVYAEDRYVDIGLGMKPELTGHGYGREFVEYIIDCVQNDYKDKKLRLTVASFNKRAIKVYNALGFEELRKFIFSKNNVEFIIMIRK